MATRPGLRTCVGHVCCACVCVCQNCSDEEGMHDCHSPKVHSIHERKRRNRGANVPGNRCNAMAYSLHPSFTIVARYLLLTSPHCFQSSTSLKSVDLSNDGHNHHIDALSVHGAHACTLFGPRPGPINTKCVCPAGTPVVSSFCNSAYEFLLLQ